jgi:hypothetical protein
MKKALLTALALCIFVALSGCAHRIDITPGAGSLNNYAELKINKNAAYYISQEDIGTQVVTPAGGGDKVKYYPYKEMEPGLRQVLSNTFNEVYALRSPQDPELVASRRISYIFIPSIATNSSSRSSWIWPPSEFWVTIDCKATDSTGKIIWQTNVKSEAFMGLP